MACGILVPRPETDPVPLSLETRSLNHQTTSEVDRGPEVTITEQGALSFRTPN